MEVKEANFVQCQKEILGKSSKSEMNCPVKYQCFLPLQVLKQINKHLSVILHKGFLEWVEHWNRLGPLNSDSQSNLSGQNPLGHQMDKQSTKKKDISTIKYSIRNRKVGHQMDKQSTKKKDISMIKYSIRNRKVCK